jgi:hypothetical protein
VNPKRVHAARALFRQPLCDRQADAARRARDQRNFTGQHLHGRYVFLRRRQAAKMDGLASHVRGPGAAEKLHWPGQPVDRIGPHMDQVDGDAARPQFLGHRAHEAFDAARQGCSHGGASGRVGRSNENASIQCRAPHDRVESRIHQARAVHALATRGVDHEHIDRARIVRAVQRCRRRSWRRTGGAQGRQDGDQSVAAGRLRILDAPASEGLVDVAVRRARKLNRIGQAEGAGQVLREWILVQLDQAIAHRVSRS